MPKSWWRHQMKRFSALLALCAGNSPVTGEFPAQRPVTRSFDVSFDLCMKKWLSKQSRGWWFETQSWSLWRHSNDCVCQMIGHCTFLIGCSDIYWTLLRVWSKTYFCQDSVILQQIYGLDSVSKLLIFPPDLFGLYTCSPEAPSEKTRNFETALLTHHYIVRDHKIHRNITTGMISRASN